MSDYQPITATAPVAHRTNATLRVARLMHVLTALFLFSLILDGPLRFLLVAKGLTPLIYLPKVLLLLAIPCLIVVRWRISKGVVAAFAIVAWALIWGTANLADPKQALFGLWVLVPLLYGLLVTRYMLDAPQAYRRLFWVLFLISAAGVLLNPFFNYPWVGASFDIRGRSIEISREWTAAGIDRYAGFSRASFSAASEILIFAIWLVATSGGRVHKLAIWLVAGVAIALTTSKGPVAAWLLLTLFFLSGAWLRCRKSWRRVWASVMFIVTTTTVVLPLTTLFISYDPKLDSASQTFLFASFGDRLARMWPESLIMLRSVPERLFGRGLGGIGTAQMYFGSQGYLAADNIFVYLSLTIGPIVAAVIIFALFYKVSKAFIKNQNTTLMFALFFIIVAYGLVMNIVEDPLLALVLGVVVTASTRSGQADE